MNLHRKLRLVALFASALGFALLIPGATIRAQTVATPAAQTDNQSPSDGGWHVGITPYIWSSGVHGTTGVLGHDASVHASFSDIFNYFNIGVMGFRDPLRGSGNGAHLTARSNRLWVLAVGELGRRRCWREV
jgi:hypothetical protein